MPEKESPKFPSPGGKETSSGSVVQFDALNATKNVPLLSKKLGQFPSGLAAGYGAGNPLLPRGSDISYAAAARASAVAGVTMDLGFNPNHDKSTMPNLNAIFNEGDVSMMDEMNRLITGFQTRNRDSLKDQNSDTRGQEPLSQPITREGSGKTATRKMSPIETHERFSNMKFQSPPSAQGSITPGRNSHIKTFIAGHLDFEGEPNEI